MKRRNSRKLGRRSGGGDEGSRLSPATAALVVVGVWLLSGLVSRRYSPDRSHPDIRRWFKWLDKPGYKPPDPVFGAVWPVLSTLLSVGVYRLLRQPQTAERDTAVALWALSLALITTYGKVAFGERSLTGGVVTGTALVASCSAYVERAARVDPALGVPITLWSAFGDALTEDLSERNPELDGRDPPGRR
jgi:tryptophan-rich sensory protein